MRSGPRHCPRKPVDVAPADVRIELLGHQRTEGADRGPFPVIGEGRRRRLAHPHEPAGPAQEVEHALRAPAQGKGHAIAGVAVAPRHHLVVDGEDERPIAGRRGARGEFRGEAAILVEKHLHPFGAGRRRADLLDGRGRGVARRIDRSEPRRRAGRGQFGVRPQQAGKTGRADDDRRRQPDAEQFDRLVALRRAGEQFRRKFHLSQRRLVAAHGDLVAGGAVDHVEQHARQPFPRHRSQRSDAIAFALKRSSVHQTWSR